MDKESNLTQRIYHAILTAALIVAGVCLILGCLFIYLSGGEQIYTLEKIASTFRLVAVPLFLTVALVIGAFILDLFQPIQQKKSVEKNYNMILRALQSKANLAACTDSALKTSIWAKRIIRIALKVLNLLVLGVSTAIFMVYALNGNNYHSSDFNGSMVKAALVWGMCLATPFFFAVATAYLSGLLVRQEIDLLRKLPLDKKPDENRRRKTVLKVLRIVATIGVRVVIVAGAVFLIIIGAIGEGWKDVLAKAAAICTECVGLG